MEAIQTIRIGDWEVAGFVECRFALDGGAMFGVVPRTMWTRLVTPDDNNLVPMQTNLFLVKTGSAVILLDTGLGDALSDFDRKLYAPKGPSNMNGALASLGVTPEQVTHVIFTHLHTDHANGAVTGDPDAPTLRFPNAEFIVQSDEWEDATHPNERTAAVYREHRLRPLEAGGKLRLINGDSEILPGITVQKTGGHTRGHQGISITNNGERFIYYGDIIPSRFHLKGPYVAAVDLFPLDTMAQKKAILAECCGSPTVVGFDHDVEVMFGRIVQKKKWMDVEAIDTRSVSLV